MNGEAGISSAVARTRPLGEVLVFRNDIIHPKDKPTGSATFVGLEHVERDTGVRIGAEHINLHEMTGRRARFCAGDIVYGYLRPYLNKVWIAEFDGICSVDQYVFTVRPGVDRNYVARFLRSANFLKTAPINSTPGQLPRIRSGEISATPIPWLTNSIPAWVSLWFAVFPTYETMAAQFLAALIVIGSYYAAKRFGAVPLGGTDSVEEAKRVSIGAPMVRPVPAVR